MMSRRQTQGFSLLEMLLAMTILVIIVLIMSTVFHQSSVAWDAGMRKAEGNMAARAVLGFMTRELRGAVVDPVNTPCLIQEGGASLSFWRVTTNGALQEIEYAWQSGAQTIERNGTQLVENVTHFSVETPDDGVSTYSTNLPRWVRIRLAMKRSADVSGVGAWSYGPDGVNGTDDDIGTW